MTKNRQVFCLGELLIDFVCSDIDKGLINGTHFIKNAGGAPANVAVTIARLGGAAVFAGCVGHDFFGQYLKNTLHENNVDVSLLKEEQNCNTTLAFVSLGANGERDFMFMRGADEQLHVEDLDRDVLLASNILHFGSATALLGGALWETYSSTIRLAREEGLFVSFDPNYRTDLWHGNNDEFIARTKECIAMSDFVKVSDEELLLLTGTSNLNDGAGILHQWGTNVVAVTLGSRGTFISDGMNSSIVESIRVKSIDSTGAGDAFTGAFLFSLCEKENPKEVLQSFEKLCGTVAFANKVGAIVCTKLGAITGIPTREEVESFVGA